jgi:hypothetical protein
VFAMRSFFEILIAVRGPKVWIFNSLFFFAFCRCDPKSTEKRFVSIFVCTSVDPYFSPHYWTSTL